VSDNDRIIVETVAIILSEVFKMKKTICGKILATLALTVLLASTVTATAFAKTIPDEYKEFTRYESFYYHTLTITTNYDTTVGEVVKLTKKAADCEPFEAYYVSVGNKTLKLSTPEGEVLTAQELDEYFAQNQVLQTDSEMEQLAWEKEMLALVNAERERLGIAPVELNTDLTKIAALKAGEMAELNYFGHTSPNYGKPWEFAKHFGYDKSVSENIHCGTSSTAKRVFEIWLNSTSGHRENMLNPKWKYIGIGTAERDEYGGDGNMKTTYHYNVQFFSK
jgi:uncharacterized protein YkwD